VINFRNYLFCESSPGYGGQEEQILETMRALGDAGSSCMLACRAGSRIAMEAEGRGLAWKPVAFRNIFDLRSIWKIRQILIRQNIDVAFCHSGHDANVLRMASYLTQKPPILLRVKTYLPGNPRARSFRALDRVLVPSTYLRDKLLENPEINGDQVDILRPLLDIEKIRSTSASSLPAAIEEFLQKHSPIIVHAAMLRPEKGHKMALSMVARLSKKFPQLGYILAGGGTDEKKLRAHATKLGIHGNVLFAGFVSPVTALMARADLLIMPSLREPLGLAQLEAMVLGVPVAVSDAGGLPETVKNGVTGWILASGNLEAWVLGVDDALSHPLEAQKRADRGQTEMEGAYSVGNYLENIEEQIRLAETPGAGREASSTVPFRGKQGQI
jgi:glycosyltransferase involved in cell wall biosynthesis